MAEKSARRRKPDPRSIAECHAHIYDTARPRRRAEHLRERIATEFPQARLGRWHDKLVGPHSQSMYQIAFPSGLVASLLPWPMLNRDGLTVLLHPETGDEHRDHTAHAACLGGQLPLWSFPRPGSREIDRSAQRLAEQKSAWIVLSGKPQGGSQECWSF